MAMHGTSLGQCSARGLVECHRWWAVVLGIHQLCDWTVPPHQQPARCLGSHGSFGLQDYLNPPQQAGQSEAEGRVGKTGGGAGIHKFRYLALEEAPFFGESARQNLKCWPGRPGGEPKQYPLVMMTISHSSLA